MDGYLSRTTGGKERIEIQHNLGKLTARERIEQLVDPGSFDEFGSLVRDVYQRVEQNPQPSPSDGVIMGKAKIKGRQVAVYSVDFTVMSGAIGDQGVWKIAELIEMAGKERKPIIGIFDGAGSRVGFKDGYAGYQGLGQLIRNYCLYSGVIPQIALLLGPCTGPFAQVPIQSDFLIINENTGFLWHGGDIESDNAGSAEFHMEESGQCDLIVESDQEAIEKARELFDFIPQNCWEKPISVQTGDDPERTEDSLLDVMPDNSKFTYDMHEVISELVDHGEYLEIKDEYAKCLITCFARFNGQPVGIVANNPSQPGSMLGINACDKYYRFLQILDSYNIPLINLVDTPPTVPGEAEEKKGLQRHIGKIVDVYATTTVPKISVILREVYGDTGGLIMGGLKSMGGDLTYAWPIAQFGVEASTLDFGKVYGKGVEENACETYMSRSREKVDVFDVGHSWTAQIIDEIILPKDTRRKIIEALELTRNKTETLPERSKSHTSPPA